MVIPRRVASLAAACAVWGWVVPTSAYYEESHITADEVRVTVDGAGIARVQHAIAWRLLAGQPHAIDLLGTEPSAVAEPTATLEGDDGRSLPATLAVVPDRGIRVTVAQPKQLRRGLYRLAVSYSVNLVDAGELARDGSGYRITWRSPVPSEGFEAPKVTFSLPAALEPPAAVIGGDGMPDDGVTAAPKRSPDRDELELLRPHVGRGETMTWTIRVDARAFDAGKTPAFTPPPPPRHDTPPGPSGAAYLALACLALGFAGLVRFKAHWLRPADGAGRGHGLVPLPSWERAAAAGAALFIGTALQLVDAPLPGVAALVLAMVCGAQRTGAPDRSRPSSRGPGRWLALRPEEAFGPRTSDWRATLGWISLGALSVAAFVAAGGFLGRAHPSSELLLPADALVLLPVLGTGLRRQLVGEAERRAGGWLERLFRRLRRVKGLRVSPWARLPTGAAAHEEVRVLVVPREPMPGLTGIEVGVAAGPASSSCVMPEVLVRVQEATAAAAQMVRLAQGTLPLPGRKPEERVYRLSPVLPTHRGTAALVLGLARRLVDRRHARELWEREERRVPPAACPPPESSLGATA